MYIADIRGTNLDVIFPMDLIPPRITRATSTAIKIPTVKAEIPNSLSITCDTELTCTPLPIPKAAIIPARANR